jgi:hypothetical protein
MEDIESTIDVAPIADERDRDKVPASLAPVVGAYFLSVPVNIPILQRT